MTAPDPLEMMEAYQRTAVIAAACETGVAAALAGEGGDAAGIAATLGLDPRGVRALVGALAALGLAERDGAGHRLSPAGAVLAPDHPSSIAGIVAKEWFFYRAWADLPGTIRDGHARIAPWDVRLRDDPATALAFLGALDDLGTMFGGGMPGLARLEGRGRVLDVAGGSGVHAAALAAAHPGLEVTVLDLPAVEPLVRERHPGLGFEPGDLHAERFGRPAGEEWDAVLLANVLHDWPPGTAGRIVREAAGLLRSGGTLVIYEWLLDESRDAPPAVAMFAVMMMVENEGGAAYTEQEVLEWMRGAGLVAVETRRGEGPIAAVTGRKP